MGASVLTPHSKRDQLPTQRPHSRVEVPPRQVVRRVALLSALAAVVGVYLYPPLAGPAAIVLSLVLCAVVFIRVHVWNAEPSSDPPADAAQREERESEVGMRTALVIGASLFVVALTISGALWGWSFTVIGTAFVLCAIVIFGAPIWAAGVGEEREDIHEAHTGEHRSSR